MKAWIADVVVRRLPNGLTLIVQPVPGLPAAALVSRVSAGFFDEPDRTAGISHVLEHMFFKGTPTRGVGEIARATKALGGYLNAGTAYDYTVYYTVLPARALPDAIGIQSDAIRNPLFDADELKREIVVIIEEARRKLDTPSAVAQETLHAELFDVHRIRRWRIGTEEVLRSLTRDDLVGYYRTRYVPQRTVVCVAGGVEAEATLDLLEQAYGGWTGGAALLDPSPPEPPRAGVRVRTLRGDVAQADLIIGWRGVPALHPDGPALDLAAAVLSGGRASRLYRAMREPGLVSSVSAYNYSPTEVGVFAIAMELPPERVEAALEVAGAEVRRLRDQGPDAESLERARTLLRVRWARRFESAEGRAMELAAAQAMEDVGLLDREYQRLLEVTGNEVRDAVRRVLDPESVAAVGYLPRDRGTDLRAEFLDGYKTGGRADAQTGRSPAETPAISPKFVDRPSARLPVRPSVAEVLHAPLPAADVLARRHAGAPLATVGLFRRRLAFDQTGQAGLSVLAVRSAVRGAGDLDTASLALAFERLGGSLRPVVNSEWYGYQVTVLPEHVKQAGVLLNLVLGTPRLDDASVAIERDLLSEDAAQSADDMYRRPVQLAAEAVFGRAGYGLPLLGTPETVRTLAVDEVRAWHRDHLATGRTTGVVVGDVDVRESLEDLAAVLDSSETAVSFLPGELPPGPEEAWPRMRVELRDKKQTALAMQFRGPDRLSESRYAAEVWAAHAGGLGGTLFEALRDRRSLAYTVAAIPWQRRRVGAIITYIATTPAREEEAREAMLSELAALRSEPPGAEEIGRAARYLAGQHEVSRQHAAAVMAELIDAWLEGTGLSELEDPARPYLAVTADQVAEVMDAYLDPEQRAEGVVRGTNS